MVQGIQNKYCHPDLHRIDYCRCYEVFREYGFPGISFWIPANPYSDSREYVFYDEH
jgi:hypothetical protein